MRDIRGGFSGTPSPGSDSVIDVRSGSTGFSGRKGPLKIMCCVKASTRLKTGSSVQCVAGKERRIKTYAAPIDTPRMTWVVTEGLYPLWTMSCVQKKS